MRLLAALAALGAAAFSQTPLLTDWNNVRELRPGAEVAVRTAAAPVEGKFVSASESILIVKESGKEQTIPRASVVEVSRRRPPRNRQLFTGIGVGLGLAGGLLASVPIGFKQCGRSCDGEKAAIAGLVIGLPVGGAILGRQLAGKGELEVVYRSR